MVIEVPTQAVYDAFDDVASVMFSKQSIERTKKTSSLLAPGDSRALMFQQRYFMILQQLFRDSKFIDVARGKRGADFPTISFFKSTEPKGIPSQSIFAIHSDQEQSWRFDITPVESLPGSTGTKVVLGMIARAENGRLCIEDIHQAVAIKMDNVSATNDFITENMFVLTKGEMIDEVFVVSEITLPPIPTRSLCESSINIFGGPTELTDEVVISTIGTAPEDASIAVLSNVLLDQPDTLEKLQELFTGFEECGAVPAAFVFLGNLSSKSFSPFSADHVRGIQKCFDAFAQLLARHPATLERSKIIIVPGHGEPGHGLYPQPPLGDALVRGLGSRFPNVVLASNPCRLRFFERQLIFFAEQNLARLRKCRLVAGGERSADNEANMLVRCMMSQMHLLPGTGRDHAVAWEYDAAMRLYPPPHALFIADSDCAAFQEYSNAESLVVGLPQFAKPNGFNGEFHLYSPSTNDSTLSSL